MPAANKLEAVFAAIYDRLVGAAGSLRLAIENDILEGGDDLSRAPDRYWSERIEERAQGSTPFRGSRGGLVWRYLLAAASWECLLARVSLLLDGNARRTVEQMGSGDAGNQRAVDEELAGVLTASLRARGFQAYVIERVASERLLEAVSHRIGEWLASPERDVGSSFIDFLVDVCVQDAEVADVCNLPWYLENARGTQAGPSCVDVAGDLNAPTLGASGLGSLTERLWEKRDEVRQAVGSLLSDHDNLRSLLLSRFMPYAECRFQVVSVSRAPEQQGLKESIPGSIVARECEERQKHNAELHADVIPREAGSVRIENRICDVLAFSSVPLLYWCAKAGIDIRPLWGDESGRVPIWPTGRRRSRQEACVAIASRLDKTSFVSAVRALSRARSDDPRATRVLITDHWDEEQAVAEFQSIGVRPNDRGFVVYRSDGLQRPLSAFRFPA
jgi:hypothetical protein